MADFREILHRLHEYCAARQWTGYDPYDALNAPVARWLPGRWARQAWTQLHRRSPVNLRPLCGIAPTLNAKAVALFALGSRDPKLLALLESLRNPDGGWGYPFPWQSRAFYAPPGTSNLVCTVLAAKAFLNCHPERSEGSQSLPGNATEILRSAQNDKLIEGAKQYIEKHLLRDGWITYTAGTDTQIHNVNLMGAALLGRRDLAEFSVRRQRADGSWWYGEAANQHWIDNFHTGYCLVALRELGGFDDAARRGFAYWARTFWADDGAPRYYPDRPYPQDVHCCAQGVLTFLAFGQPDRAARVARWAVDHLWDARGFFWHQRGRWVTNRLSYMRWGQAWMYYALSKLNAAEFS